jgi:uncharacterized protein
VEKLIVFAKAPRPGQVKTRLAHAVGEERACQIYRQLLTKVSGSLKSLANVEFHVSPASDLHAVDPWLQPGWRTVAQGAGDLGQRLMHAFAQSFKTGARKVTIIGSDCPYLQPKDIQQAWRELNPHDLVLGPATDGGYWLIALKQPTPELFEGVPWSSDQVLAETLKRAKQLKLKVQLLRILSDIDTLEDWREYERGGGEA